MQENSGQTSIEVLHVPELDAGFHRLYELKFEEARAQFAVRESSHPEDALASAAEAASYLFEECYREGVLTSEFFLDNKRFLGKIPLKPDPKLRAAFFAADKRAQQLAQLRLKTDPDDTNALFAMALSLGMQADYASLIDKKQLDSLKMLGDADKYAKKLLVILPGAADAYLGLGTANYVIGSLPGIKKFFLGFAGIHGDKKTGIQQLQVAAEDGRYLRPFAKIVLALAALREKNTRVARKQLEELVAEFPENPRFANELAKLKTNPAIKTSPAIINSVRTEFDPALILFGGGNPCSTERLDSIYWDSICLVGHLDVISGFSLMSILGQRTTERNCYLRVDPSLLGDLYLLQRSADKEHLHEQNLPTSIWALLIIAFLYLLRFCIDVIIGELPDAPPRSMPVHSTK